MHMMLVVMATVMCGKFMGMQNFLDRDILNILYIHKYLGVCDTKILQHRGADE